MEISIYQTKIWLMGFGGSDMATDLGFENGDKFVAADGEKIERFSDVLEKVIISKTITVERNGVETDITCLLM